MAQSILHHLSHKQCFSCKNILQSCESLRLRPTIKHQSSQDYSTTNSELDAAIAALKKNLESFTKIKNRLHNEAKFEKDTEMLNEIPEHQNINETTIRKAQSVNRVQSYNWTNHLEASNNSAKQWSQLQKQLRENYNNNNNTNQFRYSLEASQPHESENFVNIYSYYRQRDRYKESKLATHLQPCNIKPFGNSDNHYYPVYTHIIKRSVIQYPEGQPQPSTRWIYKGRSSKPFL